jgi:hypothetical protein
MRILIGSGAGASERELATVAWTAEQGLVISGPQRGQVAALMEREYRRWFDPSAGGQWVTLADEELVLSLPYRLPRPQWWAIELTVTGERLPPVPYDPHGTIWRQLSRPDRAAATGAAVSLLRDRSRDPNAQVLLTWIEGEGDAAIYHFIGLSPAVSGSQQIAVYQVRTGAWHAILETSAGEGETEN